MLNSACLMRACTTTVSLCSTFSSFFSLQMIQVYRTYSPYDKVLVFASLLQVLGSVNLSALRGCYAHLPMKNTFYNAEAICNNNGGSLASIHSATENEYVLGVLGFAGEQAWIGLFRLDFAETADYMWIDESSVGYVNWAENGKFLCVMWGSYSI